MRIHSILVAAMLAALPGIPASAQSNVYSGNVVGYATVVLKPGLNLVANPMTDGTNNHLNNILRLPDSADGTVVFRFDALTQSYRDAFTFLAGIGWYPVSGDTNDAIMTLHPGEGFFIAPGSPALSNITFVGEVLQGTLTNPIPANYSLKASLVPQAGGLVSALSFHPAEADIIDQWNSTNQSFHPSSVYSEVYPGFGRWDPQEPMVNVAEGFVVWRDPVQATPDNWWIRHFTVDLQPLQAGAFLAGGVSSTPAIRNLSIAAGQVKLAIHNPGEAHYDVQFSGDGQTWDTVAEDQVSTEWTAPFPGGVRGCYRLVKR